MAILNEYRITLASGTEKRVVRVDAVAAAQASESETDPIRQIQFLKGNLDVALPSAPQPVYFEVSVTPDAAAQAYCRAAPSNYTVESGTHVIFQASPEAGFVFDGWYLDAPIDPSVDDPLNPFDPTVPVSTDATAVIPVYQPAPGQTRRIEARFAPAP